MSESKIIQEKMWLFVTSHLFSIAIASFKAPEVLLASWNLDFRLPSKTSLLEQVFQLPFTETVQMTTNYMSHRNLQIYYWGNNIVWIQCQACCASFVIFIWTALGLFHTKVECDNDLTVDQEHKTQNILKIKQSHYVTLR